MAKKVFTLKKLVTSIFMMLTATLVMNAQTQVNPWHIVVSDAGGKEVASHSIEIITDVTVSGDEVDFLLDNGATYSYPITSTFAFAQRAGNGTAIETVAAPMWNVSYSAGTLHFTEPVNSVAVYTISGVLIAKISGNSTSIPVSLGQGLYIVQADGKAAKLLVTSSGNGGISQSTSTTANYNPTLRAATAALSQYWNVSYGSSTMPVDISEVDNFYFSNNSLVFALKSGNSIELANYQGVTFSVDPAPAVTSSKWDLSRTLKVGGASYWFNFNTTESEYNFMCGVAVTASGDVIGKFLPNTYVTGEFNFAWNTITYPNFWYMGALTLVFNKDKVVVLAMCGPDPKWGGIAYYAYNSQPSEFPDYSTYNAYGLNGGIPALKTSISEEANGNLYMTFTDVYSGKGYSVELSAP